MEQLIPRAGTSPLSQEVQWNFGMQLIPVPRAMTFPEDGDVENSRFLPSCQNPLGFSRNLERGEGSAASAGGAPALTNAGN